MTFERQKPLWWECAKAILIAAVAIAGFTGCSTTITHRAGTPWIKSYSNIKHLEAKSGDESIVIDGMNNSTPTREAGKVIGTIAGDIATLFAPGSGEAVTAIKGATIALPHLTNMSSPGN